MQMIKNQIKQNFACLNSFLKYVEKKLSAKSLLYMLKINVLHHLSKFTQGVKTKLHNSKKDINIKSKVFRF